MLRLLPLLGALWVWSLTPAGAQQIGDPEAGFAVAADACVECHDIMPMEGVSPEPNTLPFEDLEAKPFEEIANTTGVTAMALTAWMQSTHPTMPNLILEDDDLRNVVAYILSLKDR
jgi:mono/diheme cytochrome c family protein